jgi:hypothetical protein
MAFWKQLKNGADHFEVTKAEVPVQVCDRKYVFGAKAEGGGCSRLNRDTAVEAQVAAKADKDDAEVAQLVAKGEKPIRLVYADGGQNPAFRYQGLEESRPDAIAEGPHEIVVDSKGKPIPTAVEVAAADARASDAAKSGHKAAKPMAAIAVAVAAAPAPTTSAPSSGGFFDGGKRMMASLFKAKDTSPAVQVYEPDSPIPSDAPLPPRRAASLDAPLREAALHENAAKRDDADAAAE